jgi:outer membrane protein assembly factor BamE (lipoprotein component of BamABCDE complex)
MKHGKCTVGMLVLFAAIMLAGGCIHTMGSRNLEDPLIISKIEKGKSTKQDVQNLIGPPMSVSFNDKREEIWVYMRMKSTVRSTTFIPVVGLFDGGNDMTMHQVTIVFDLNGVVSCVGSGVTTGGGGGLQDLGR